MIEALDGPVYHGHQTFDFCVFIDHSGVKQRMFDGFRDFQLQVFVNQLTNEPNHVEYSGFPSFLFLVLLRGFNGKRDAAVVMELPRRCNSLESGDAVGVLFSKRKKFIDIFVVDDECVLEVDVGVLGIAHVSVSIVGM